ncbi:hypothetical protein [Clostridium estertheticum]|uniref:hypothetical protein n=1 Tax=Clostridium estertheticum TaxID=238834 RepID=UPI001CF4843F|nr:hypothetical protein [Clostridium estertheticum]MCB2356173.1 hypothetical protein [Clostridium estertheticum]WAG43679.1 hypothetical protein LL065_25080 [Clostridium estertheticum]
MKVTKILSVMFGLLTICGAMYIFYTGGRSNAGYAVIPMIFLLVLSGKLNRNN